MSRSGAPAYHHGDLRAELLDTAAAVLEADGPDAITMRGLARRVGVSHAAPGHHFPSRDALIGALVEQGFAELGTRLESAVVEGLAAVGRAYVAFGVERPQMYRLMFTSCLRTEPDTPAGARAYQALLDAASSAAVDEITAWSLVHGLVMLWLDGQLGDVGTTQFQQRAAAAVDSLVDRAE